MMLEKKPSRKPLGLVVVKPTLMFSAMVDLQLPMKSYLMIELALMFTPISAQYIKKSVDGKYSLENNSEIEHFT